MKLPILAVCTALFAGAAHAHSIGRLANVEVIDRTSGATLETYYYRGEYWVAGAPGSRYAISVRNRLGERLLAVTAVDGVNVVSGETASWDQTGYVFGPGQGYEITGWRKSDAEVAAFEFTSAPNSYAERTGRPANVGVIGVALFRERLRPVLRMPIVPPTADPRASDANAAGSAAGRERAETTQGMAAAPEPKLGTGHGEREASYVDQTEFLRRQSQPDEIIHIRYDSRDHLVAMGVIRTPSLGSPAPNPFPDSQPGRYVPDPPYRVGALR